MGVKLVFNKDLFRGYIYLVGFRLIRYLFWILLVLAIVTIKHGLFPLFAFLFILDLILLVALNNLKNQKIKTFNTGQDITRDNDQSTLLIINKENIKPTSFNKLDFSYGWINLLEQEIGNFDILDTTQINEKTIKNRKLIVLTTSAKDTINIPNLLKHVEKGNTLIIDNKNQEIDYQIKLYINYFGNLYSKKHKKGGIIFLDFNLGKRLTEIQQGKPNNNYTLKNKHGIKEFKDTQSLIFSKQFQNNTKPYADVAKKTIIQEVEQYTEIPRLYNHQYKYDGTLIITHDEDYYGDKILYMQDIEKTQNNTSTFFLNQSSNKAPEELDSVGLHFDLFLNKSYQQQKQELETKAKKNIVLNRNHFMLWQNHYTNMFNLLKTNNIEIDSSYGPNYGKGYLFGTGSHFQPIDTNGKPINIKELPFHTLEDRAKNSKQFQETLLKQSKNQYHNTLSFLFHPNLSENESISKELWLNSFKLSKKYNHQITNLNKYNEFHKARTKTIIKNKEIITTNNNQSLITKYKKSKHRTITILNKKYSLIQLKKGRNKL